MSQDNSKNFNPYEELPSWFKGNRCYDLARDSAIKIAKICKEFLPLNDFVLGNYANQISKSSSSVLANLSEALISESNAMKSHNMYVVIKEANETMSWCLLLNSIDIMSEDDYKLLIKQYTQIVNILTASISTLKSRKI